MNKRRARAALATLPLLLYGSWCVAALAPSLEALVKPKVSESLLQLLKANAVLDLAQECKEEVATDGETRFRPTALPDIVVHLYEDSPSLKARRLTPKPTLSKARLEYVDQDTRLGFIVVRVKGLRGRVLENQHAAVVELASHRDVRRVEPNCSYEDPPGRDDRAAQGAAFAYPAPASGPDPYFQQQWGLKLLPAPDVWRLTDRQARPLVAVLDTGIDCSNPELQSKLRVSGTNVKWPTTPNEPCPDGVGKDFVGRTDDDPSACVPFGRCNWHGTHMAAIIAAQTDNLLGIAAVAPDAQLLIVRTNNERDKPTSAVNRARAIMYAVDEGATILNISQEWTIWSDTAMQSALRHASKALVNIAAGNQLGAPTADPLSSFPNVTYAMALSDSGALWLRSNRVCWKRRAMVAPGYQIHAAIVAGNVEQVTGTSPATAFVSGAHALLRSVPAYQNYSTSQIHELLFDSTPPASFEIQGATGPCKPPILCLAALTGGQCP